jgi:plasmid stabilization system protein ParE
MGNYVTFFHYVGPRGEAVSILHGHRDIEAVFAVEP